MTAPVSGPLTVIVAIATCGRPQGLDILLEGLTRLRLDPATTLGVVVVDNNADGSAGTTVLPRVALYPHRLDYVHEPRRGISFARNAALAAAAGRCRFIAFIDDDEVPEPDWIAALLRKQAETDADVVTGPVLPRFAVPAPRWARDGGFYAGPDHDDGTALTVAFTNNVLIRAELLAAGGYRFDEALALSGGEDTMMFSAMHAAGHRLVWAREARVEETIPASRLRLAWLIRRWYRTGSIDALVAVRGRPAGTARLMLLGKGLVRLGVGLALLAASALVLGFGRSSRVVGRLYTPARGAGMIAAALNRTYQEYQVIHAT